MSSAPYSGGWAIGIWSFFWNSIVRVLWLVGYDTVAVLLVAYLFIGNDQGQDLLRISAERGVSLWNLIFLLGAAALALTVWYTARLLLGREYPGYPLTFEQAAWGRKWLPRVLGAAIPLSVAVGFLRLESEHATATIALGLLYLALAAGAFWFFVARRKLLGIGEREMLLDPIGRLKGWNLGLILGALALSLALTAAFMAFPVTLPQWLGAPAIVLLGLAGIALFGSMVLTYAFLAKGQPAGTALALALAIVFGFVNDNHWVRLTGDAPAPPRAAAAAHYREWREANPVREPARGRQPVVLVAASGGGIRAAYWTASTLAAMDGIPGFSDNLFAISGVSGGSVGAATYVALQRERLVSGQADSVLPRAREVLAEDFLSPVVAGLLFPDLIQRFIPFPVAWADRQRFLERAWEAALGPTPNAFADAFTDLYAGGYQARLPSLLLNATVVDSGRRALVANMDVTSFTDLVDLMQDGYATRAVRLSAAAGMSARFTYVSPAGSLLQHEEKMRVVDGGYFENSGAATLMDLLDALRQDAAPEIFPILVLIRNDPAAAPVCHRSGSAPALGAYGPEGPQAGDVLSEIASPIRALLNARSARGRLAEVDAARRVEGPAEEQSQLVAAARSVEAQGGAVVEISLAAVASASLARATSDEERALVRAKMIEPPLGWSLSRAVRDAMDRVLDERGGGLDREMGVLEAALAGHAAKNERCNAR